MDEKTSHPPDDQRLRSIEQQLKAANQQLRASEQQLRAANQQLTVSEEKLREQNEFLNNVLEALTYPFYVVDANDYTVKLANRAANFGTLTGDSTCYALTHKRSEPCRGVEHPCPLNEIKKTKKPVTVEHIHYDKDGNHRYIEIHAHPIFDSAGNISEMIEYCLDITERKRAEEALAEQHRLLRTLIDNLPDSVYVKNTKSQFVIANIEVARRMDAASPDDLIGKTDLDFHPRQLASRYCADEQEVIRSGQPLINREEQVIDQATGETIWNLTSKVPLRDSGGNIVGIMGIGRNITERKQAEETLARSERIYRRTIENAQGVPYQLRFADGEYVFMGAGVEELVGIPAEELTQESFTEMAQETIITDLCGYDNPDAYCEAFKRGEMERFQADIRICTPKGQTKWFSDCSLPIRDEETGEVTGCIGVLQDITRRKLAEEERKKLIVDLEVKNAELERFTYAVSHDLKSPLITIKGFLGMLGQDAAKGDTEQMNADMARISNAAEKMRQLLDELLELSRIGRLVSPPERLSLEELAREAVELVAGRITERGVRIGISPDLPVVFGDRQRLLNVLQNLVDNAVKFMGDEPEPCIEIGVRPVPAGSGEAICYVKDNGIGIDPSYHEKIFGLFDKLDRESEGTGVGLALVKRIIEVHGGRIWVESEGAGRSSTFCFTIPVYQD